MLGRLVLGIGAILALQACANKKEAVYIPTKCDIQMPAKPYARDNQSTAQRVAEILQYTELLEADLSFCIGK